MANNLALFTDLYELTMAQAYFEEGMTEDAVFSLFVRRRPCRPRIGAHPCRSADHSPSGPCPRHHTG